MSDAADDPVVDAPQVSFSALCHSPGVDAEPLSPDRRTVIRGFVGVVGGAVGLGLSGCSSSEVAAPRTVAGSATASAREATSPAPPATSPSTPTRAAWPDILQQPGPDLASGSRTGNAVALTFHGAGDAVLTAQALEIVRSAGAHLTVFAVGQWLSANPQLGRDIVAAGHDLGNHTWSHQTMTRLTPQQADQEIRDGAHAVAGAIGTAGLLFRPSGTPTSTATIRAAALASGYQRCISYDVDPEDYLDPGSTAVRSRTLAAVAGGSIVSLHLGHPGTIEALPGILQGLAARGLNAVRITDLLAQT